MKILRVTTAIVWALTILLLAPLEANAGGRGGGVRVGGHHVVNRHHALARQQLAVTGKEENGGRCDRQEEKEDQGSVAG